ncbi:hypothetical protein GCM10025859_55450 [Alicyclobacillus fastidiosus]|nr:hypothetical protein GCM10025859_55450 [Alicyclobacillus fastidiosus]
MAAKQLEAVCAVRPVTDVLVYNRTRTKAESFIDQVQEEFGLPLVYHLVDSAEMAVRAADIVVASTTSVEPVVRFDWLKPGAHVNAVGAFHKGMQEIDEDTVVNARYRVVDGIDAAAVSGDIANPLERGRIGRDALLEIGALVANKDAITRSNRDITLYKSVGLSVLDMAVANEVLVKAECLGVGDVCNSL